MAATDFQSLLTLIDNEIPDGRKSLQENYANLERVAKYCESNYLQANDKRKALEETKNYTTHSLASVASVVHCIVVVIYILCYCCLQANDKRKALEETKNYTTHSLASVAYQVNQLATNFLKLLDLQQSQLANMESSVNHLSQIVMIHKEKVARREIGVLTTNRTASRPMGVKSGILFPEQTERPIKYTRKAIDYSSLDDIGHGVRPQSQTNTPRTGRSPSVSSNSSGSQAPTTRPPTPPQYRQGNQGGGGGTGGGGTLGRSSGGGHYRSIPPPVAPSVPQQGQQSQQPPAAPSPGQSSPGNSNTPVRIQGPYAPAPNVTMGQVRLPQGMLGRPASHMGREAMAMGPGHMMNMGVPAGVDGRQRSNMHVVQPTPAPLTGHESMGNSAAEPREVLFTAVFRMAAMFRFHYQSGLRGQYMDMPPPPPHLSGDTLLLQASPPLPPPPESGVAFDYPQPAPLPPPEFSDRGGDEDSNPLAAPPEDPYAATGPGFLGPDEFMPASYIEKVVAIYDYEADKEDELSFSENSVIYVIRKNDDGWWEGVMDGVAGLFPSNYVEPCM
ncbi:hypothetical protein ACOMHN_023847 [Nucella lapillus]